MRPQPAMHTNAQVDHRAGVAAQTAVRETFSAASADDDERVQLITFCSDGERYAVDILEVQQIASLSQVTLGTFGAGPHSGPVAFVWHGETVPILDLRPRARAMLTPMHVVVVVQNRWGPLGLLADQMPDVITADLSSLHAAPRLLRLHGLDVPAGDLTIAGRRITLIDPCELRISSDIQRRPAVGV